ncbi:hypothetical protein L6452_00456 [Arctium lappa]|uniref:Uncharacterized protein n=1 Tax=Arctium lappa TaxID=4217 RepID=A0ACB9FES2_ARCLA|nr:hypothetical protein L6452_00456 [Arctium lappa]
MARLTMLTLAMNLVIVVVILCYASCFEARKVLNQKGSVIGGTTSPIGLSEKLFALHLERIDRILQSLKYQYVCALSNRFKNFEARGCGVTVPRAQSRGWYCGLVGWRDNAHRDSDMGIVVGHYRVCTESGGHGESVYRALSPSGGGETIKCNL